MYALWKQKWIYPKTAILPGSVLKLELDERGISQKDFADIIGIETSNLNEYIRGKVLHLTSLKLEKLCRYRYLDNLQLNYKLAVARKQKLDIDEQAALNKKSRNMTDYIY